MDRKRSVLTLTLLQEQQESQRSKTDERHKPEIIAVTKHAGLSRELDRGLNARVAEIVDLVGDAIVADGGGPAGRRRHLGTAASASVFGIVLMLRTGRLDVLGETPDAVLETLVP